MRIAILGGTGQIGSVITCELLKAFPKAEILSCSRGGGSQEHNRKFNVLKDDWTILGKLDYIINSVGIIEQNGENTFKSIHIDVVKKIIKRKKSLGNPMIIHISVLGANTNSRSKYSSSKGRAEEILTDTERWNIIKPSFVCSPETTIVKKIRMMKNMSRWFMGFLPIPAQFLKSEFQPVMVEDISELVKQCIYQNLNQEVIYATGEETYTLRDWINITGKGGIKIIEIPKWFVDATFSLFTLLFPKIMNKEQYELIQYDNIYSDNHKFHQILKRKPISTKNFWHQQL